MDAVWSAVTKLYGELGASLTGLSLINCDSARKVYVVRTSLATLPSVRASLATIISVGGVQASVHVLVVSGTLKALFSNL